MNEFIEKMISAEDFADKTIILIEEMMNTVSRDDMSDAEMITHIKSCTGMYTFMVILEAKKDGN